MVTSRKDYNEVAVQAAHSVLLELVRILGEYRHDIVVVGGWVPALLFENAKEKHIGSTDVDIAINHTTVDEAGYKTIRELLIGCGYKEGRQPFIFFRVVSIGDNTIEVEVDFLSGEYGGTGKTHRTQKVQDMRIRKARGCEIAFEQQKEMTIEGFLPNGAKDNGVVNVAAIVPFIVMKAMAMHDRIKEKDAWDIYYCVKHYPGGNENLAEDFRAYLHNKLVKEGLAKIAEKFATFNHYGPTAVADFEELTDPDERAIRQRDAFERITDLLARLK
jgi:predicted nucleotidyltransferase